MATDKFSDLRDRIEDDFSEQGEFCRTLLIALDRGAGAMQPSIENELSYQAEYFGLMK